MDVSEGDDSQLFPTEEELPDRLKLFICAAQLAFPDLKYSGRLISATAEDCQLQLLARDAVGHQLPEWTLDIEVYMAGTQRSLMIERQGQLDYPILWQGQYAVWMDAETGLKVERPAGGDAFEGLARRLMKKLQE
ncbi:MAG: hypothetical protein WA902_18965 [Thermosynechococcaceae cyanobacterium]